MIAKVRCSCGSEFGAKDLSGNVRTECPFCRAVVASVPDAEPLPLMSSPVRPVQPAQRAVVAAASTPTMNVEAAAHSSASGGRWLAPTGLCNHAGLRLDAAKYFPWGPPAQIGEILCADSNVLRSGPPSFITPWLIALGIWVATYIVLGEGLQLVGGKGDPTIVRAAAAGLGLLAGLLSLLWTWPTPPRCTYVGRQGAAYFKGKWPAVMPTESQVIVFRDVAALFTSTTHFYKNFIYQHTQFEFELHGDLNKAPLLTIEDQHSCHNDPPEPDSLLHFGLRVEDMWTTKLMERLGAELSANRTVVFPCRKSHLSKVLTGLATPNNMREIRLNQSQIQFVYADRLESMAIRDLGTFEAKRGVLKFQQDDATWFSRQGKFRIDYQHLGNAKAFLRCLSMIVAAQ